MALCACALWIRKCVRVIVCSCFRVFVCSIVFVRSNVHVLVCSCVRVFVCVIDEGIVSVLAVVCSNVEYWYLGTALLAALLPAVRDARERKMCD